MSVVAKKIKALVYQQRVEHKLFENHADHTGSQALLR